MEIVTHANQHLLQEPESSSTLDSGAFHVASSVDQLHQGNLSANLQFKDPENHSSASSDESGATVLDQHPQAQSGVDSTEQMCSHQKVQAVEPMGTVASVEMAHHEGLNILSSMELLSGMEVPLDMDMPDTPDFLEDIGRPDEDWDYATEALYKSYAAEAAEAAKAAYGISLVGNAAYIDGSTTHDALVGMDIPYDMDVSANMAASIHLHAPYASGAVHDSDKGMPTESHVSQADSVGRVANFDLSDCLSSRSSAAVSSTLIQSQSTKNRAQAETNLHQPSRMVSSQSTALVEAVSAAGSAAEPAAKLESADTPVVGGTQTSQASHTSQSASVTEGFKSESSHLVSAIAAIDSQPEPFEPKAFLKTVPNRPGSYRMYDKTDTVIYVGKAKDLKKRLSSYFLKRGQNTKTQVLVANIARIEFTVTFSESEALILENELIKKYQPRYNILLRDDKTYPYLLLTSKHEHPGIYYHRGAKRKLGEYFGPFPDSSAVKDSLRLLQRLFPVRQCEDSVYAHRSRPCLMAQMGRCLAPCVPMSPEKAQHYQEQVSLLRLFLKGQNQKLLQTMAQRMEEHAEKLEFEEAALLRDQMTALRRVQESNSIISDVDYPLDVIGHAIQDGLCCIHVLFIRQGRLLGSRSFFPKLSGIGNPAHILFSFLTQFYLNETHLAMLPDEILLDCHLPSLNASAGAVVEDESGAGAVASIQNSDFTAAETSVQIALFDQSKHPELSNRADKMVLPTQTACPESVQLTESGTIHCEFAAVNAATVAKDESSEKQQPETQRVQGKTQADAHQMNEAEHPDSATKQSLAIELVDSDEQSKVQASAESKPEIAGATAVAEPEEGVDELSDSTLNEMESVDLSILSDAFEHKFSKKIRFAWIARGAKSRYVKLATANAQVALQSKLSSQTTAHQRVEELEQLLGLAELERMECYDISHTMGENTVASCVVFNREGPDPTRYRRYNIHDVAPGDDFAAMHQVLSRRFKDPDHSELPQLIFIDGGMGQLAQAEEVLTQAFAHAKHPMPMMVAVAKGEGRKAGLETLITGFTHEELHMPLTSAALQLVLHIRDESHRFAITGHRAKRAKVRTTSKLESISGIGPKRRQALLQHLGGLQEVLRASVDELQKVPGISLELANKIYDELHSL